MVRGGKFKQRRGGGRSFSKDLGFDGDHRDGDERKTEGDAIEEGKENSDSDESSEEEEEEEDSDEEPAASQPELTRAQRRELKKKQGGKEKAKAEAAVAKAKAKQGDEDEDEDDEEDDKFLINPNHVQKKMTISDLNKPRDLSRKEREQKEKQEAKDRYWKLHMQGKTDEAKNDLHRLAKIRADREASQAKRKAEAEAKAKEAEDKKQAQIAKKK